VDNQSQNILKKFKPGNILIAIVIGLVASGFIFYQSFDAEKFSQIESANLWWILAIIILIVIRQLAYMYRIRYVTLKQLSWSQSFDIILLWEFASALSPTMVGGSAVSIFFLNKEKISIGKSTAFILITTILDGIFFTAIAPIVFLLIKFDLLFPQVNEALAFFENVPFQMPLIYFFFVAYFAYFIYCILFSYAIFIKPYSIAWLFSKIFSISFLSKWKLRAIEECNNLAIAAEEIRGKDRTYWFHLIASTLIVWIARFLVINALIAAFMPVSEHLLIFGRQVIMWTILIFTPTPGGSVVAEFVFPVFLGKFVTNEALWGPLTFFWRFLTYYPYLILGAFILPRWIKRVFKKEPEANEVSEKQT